VFTTAKLNPRMQQGQNWCINKGVRDGVPQCMTIKKPYRLTLPSTVRHTRTYTKASLLPHLNNLDANVDGPGCCLNLLQPIDAEVVESQHRLF